MSPKLRRWSVGLVLLVALSLLLAAKFSSFVSKGSAHPPDETLEENFREHEAEFDSLIRMSNDDPKVVRIAHNFTWLDTNAHWPRPDSEIGFSKERWGQYRRAFQALGLEQGLLKPLDTDTIFLIASSKGGVASGSAKGYAYSTKTLSPLSDSLDHIPPELLNLPVVYKRLERNWYLFYQSN